LDTARKLGVEWEWPTPYRRARLSE
jgi:hypothetical protein